MNKVILEHLVIEQSKAAMRDYRAGWKRSWGEGCECSGARARWAGGGQTENALRGEDFPGRAPWAVLRATL